MIVGLESVTEGEIRVDGELVNDIDPKDRDMAMVFQSYAIYPHMTVRENISFPLKLAKIGKREIEERVTWAAEILELEELLGRKPGALSGGQRQRVAMGRAIVRQPKAFLLDEPLSNLDAKLRLQMRTELVRLQRRLGTTMVYVTHDQTEAMTLGHRIAVLRGGRVLQIGTPRELYERPNSLFVAGFIGSPPMNFLPARSKDGHLSLPIGEVELGECVRELLGASSGPLIAAFRPEHLRASGEEGGRGLELEAEAEVVEWLGADVIVHVRIDSKDFARISLPEDLGMGSGQAAERSLLARVDPSAPVKEGESIRLTLDPRHIHLFDAESGESLEIPAEARGS
jgi:multiple sugar transport system ATP-binding protein